jgi:hypothetical protein
MPFKINEKTKEQTTKCPHSFKCLEDEKSDMCSVEWCLKGNGCFLKKVKPQSCPYRIRFGNSHLCNCPVRREIYRRYTV